MSRRPLAALALALAPTLAARPAAAQACTTIAGNLVQNCGFEGPTAGTSPAPSSRPLPSGYVYTAAPNGGAAGVTSASGTAHSGSHAFFFGDLTPDTFSSLSQTLSTTAGATYAISFYAKNTAGGSEEQYQNSFSVMFGNQLLFGDLLLNGEYQPFTFTGVATGASTALAFAAYNRPGANIIDDLSVVETTAAVTTAPEPGTWALLGTGLLAVGGVAVRRKRTTG